MTPVKKILINSTPWQKRAAIVDDDILQDIYYDTDTSIDLEKCFFRGKITKLLPGLQTAFVYIGQEKSGFLHISEIDRVMAAERIMKTQFDDGIEGETYDSHSVKKVMDIGKVFKEQEDVLVQVIKEPVYEKGAKLTTCFTLPGKFIVLMPNIPQIGISKKIGDKTERFRLRDILQSCLPDGMGAIVRTNSAFRDARVIKKDVNFLVSIWKSIQNKYRKSQAGDLLFSDLPLGLRVMREHLNESIDEIHVDSNEEFEVLRKYIENLMPEKIDALKKHEGPLPLFASCGEGNLNLETQIAAAMSKKVPLPSGGSILIETTEAMTVIDVNTGKYTGKDNIRDNNLEETIFRINNEAAIAIADQLRLRNIGGLIVIDFIDMSQASNRNQLSINFEKALKERDRVQSVTLKVSEFGIVQMTRKRSGKPLIRHVMDECVCCKGLGFMKSYQSVVYEIFDKCMFRIKAEKISGPYRLVIAPDIFDYIASCEGTAVMALERQIGGKLVLESDDKLSLGDFRVEKGPE